MKQAAVSAISSCIPADQLAPDHIIVSALTPGVADKVAQAVAQAARESGVIRHG